MISGMADFICGIFFTFSRTESSNPIPSEVIVRSALPVIDSMFSSIDLRVASFNKSMDKKSEIPNATPKNVRKVLKGFMRR